MLIQELLALREAENPYFVMDISHEENNEIQFHVLKGSVGNDYHIQVMVNESTWEIDSISGWDKQSIADVEKDKQLIVDAVNEEITKHQDLKQVKLTDRTQINK